MDSNLNIYDPAEKPRETCYLDLMRRLYLEHIGELGGLETKRLVSAVADIVDDFLRFVDEVLCDPGACIVYGEDRIRIKLLSDTFTEDHPRPKKPA